MDDAYTNFFKGRSKFPKYKSKSKSRQSFNVPQNVKLVNNKLVIPKFKEGINVKIHRELEGQIRQSTISKTPTGKYFVSILVKTNNEQPPKPEVTESNTIGIDLGIKDFLVTSDGQTIDNPKYLRELESKLKFIQRRYSKYRGRKNKKKLQNLHEKIKNKRKDFLHKVSSELVRENQSIALEDLNVSGMVKNHKLAKSISDASWSSFVRMLEYKADWYGVNVMKIGRFEPSSKTCSECGNVNQKLELKDRIWTCDSFNTTLDRDLNAAVNIKLFSLNNLSGGPRLENHGELPSVEGVKTHEAHRSLVGG